MLDPRYLAGFIDGEGYIGLYPHNKSDSHHVCAIKIGQTGRGIAVLEELQRECGGDIHKRQYNGRRQAAQWSLRGKSPIAAFLTPIEPYLRVKKRQAQAMLEFCRLPNNSPLYKSYDPKITDKKRELMLEIKSLIAEGRPVATTE